MSKGKNSTRFLPMPEGRGFLAKPVDRRLASLADADPFDQQTDRNSLRLATEILKLIRAGRREPEAAKLAKRTLRILRERRRMTTEMVVTGDPNSNPYIDGTADGSDDISGVQPREYVSTAARDLSAAQHAVAALTEALHLKEPCSCNSLRCCETCRIIDRMSGGLDEAAEFLLPVPGDVA